MSREGDTMSETASAKIKRILSSHPDSIIFYHELNEWSIYRAGGAGNDVPDPHAEEQALMEGNDYRNVRGYAPELVTALAEMLGIKVKSGARGR